MGNDHITQHADFDSLVKDDTEREQKCDRHHEGKVA